MFQPINQEIWERREHYAYYTKTLPCGYSVTVRLDVTNLYEEVKRHGLKFYPAFIYCASKAVNEMKEFRMGKDAEGNPGIWDVVHPNYTIFHEDDRSVYFDTNFHDNFSLIGYEWNGPEYQIVTNTVTKQKGKKTQKGKSGKMTAGALVGTMFMPGIGTAVGAAIGAGGKSKTKNNGTETSDTTQKQVEIPSKAMLYLKNNETNKDVNIIISCDSNIDMELKRFKFLNNSQKTDASDVQKVAEALKSLKELVDLGVLSQEEFETKKAELLNN